jgi:hypothetical protein
MVRHLNLILERRIRAALRWDMSGGSVMEKSGVSLRPALPDRIHSRRRTTKINLNFPFIIRPDRMKHGEIHDQHRQRVRRPTGPAAPGDSLIQIHSMKPLTIVRLRAAD